MFKYFSKLLESFNFLAFFIALSMINQVAHAEQSFFDVGYSPTNGSITQSIGFGIYGLKEENSYYVNLSFGLKPGEYQDYTHTYYGTAYDVQQVPFTFNIGKTFPIIPDGTKVPIYKSIHSYVGIGYGSLSGIAKDSYYGDSYYFDYHAKDTSGLNINGGLIFMFQSFGLNIGYNSFTKTPYLNIGVMLN